MTKNQLSRSLKEKVRATIETLNLNRKGLVNLRQILYPMGEHPPRLNQP